MASCTASELEKTARIRALQLRGVGFVLCCRFFFWYWFSLAHLNTFVLFPASGNMPQTSGIHTKFHLGFDLTVLQVCLQLNRALFITTARGCISQCSPLAAEQSCMGLQGSLPLLSIIIASTEVHCPFSAPYFAALVLLSACLLASRSGGAGASAAVLVPRGAAMSSGSACAGTDIWSGKSIR